MSALVARGAETFAEEPRASWLRKAAKRALASFGAPPRSRFRDLVRTVESALVGTRGLHVGRFPVPALAMGAMPWQVPALVTTGDLAAWLDVFLSLGARSAGARHLRRNGISE